MSIVLITGSCGLVGSESVKFFTSKGYDVVGIDVDIDKCKIISNGNAPFFEPELEETLKTGLTKKLKISNDFGLINNCDFLFVTVGTPQNVDGSIDLSMIKKSVK